MVRVPEERDRGLIGLDERNVMFSRAVTHAD